VEQFLLSECFLKFILVKAIVIIKMIQCAKINLSENVFRSVIVTITNAKAMFECAVF